MQRLFTVALVALALTACSGGGGGVTPTPQPKPTQTPIHPTTYTVRIAFHGGDALHSQSLGRSTEVFIHPFDTTTAGQSPVVMSVPNPANSYFANDDVQSQGVASAVVDPAPSAQPDATFNVVGAPNVSVNALPVPTPTGSPVPPQAALQADQGAAPVAATLNANVNVAGATITDAVPLFLVSPGHLACGDVPLYDRNSQIESTDQWGGVTITGGVVAQATDINSADLYLDGSWCTQDGFVNQADTDVTLYAPHGAVLISSTVTSFASLTAAMWSNSFTSITLASLEQQATDPVTPKDELLVQTASGKVVEIALNEIGSGTPPSNGVHGTPATLNFSYQQSGYSVNGF